MSKQPPPKKRGKVRELLQRKPDSRHIPVTIHVNSTREESSQMLGDDLDLEGRLQKARLRTRMFDVPFEPPMLGRYAVQELLGRGGMGEVYKAHDPELGRHVAIKLLRLDLREQARERLLFEARAMAQIEHNQVVRVYDVGTWNERDYVVMECIDGTTLREWQGNEARGLHDILDAYVQAGKGLARIHGAGLVHRDFKPDNVLADRHGRVVVGDLGLVHAAEVTEGQGTSKEDEEDHESWLLARTLTGTGLRVGTPGYMSPEQLRGQPTDGRSDQFSFCVALYEAMYGELPFAGDTEKELAMAVVRGEMRPQPRGRKVPGWLDKIVRRGLSPEPDARFVDMNALLLEIARQQRRRKVVTSSVLGVAAMAAVGAYVLMHALAPKDENPCAEIDNELAGIWDDARRKELEQRITASKRPEAAQAWLQFEIGFNRVAGSWKGVKEMACGSKQTDRESRVRNICLIKNKVLMQQMSDRFAASDVAPQHLDGVLNAAKTLRERRDCTDAEPFICTEVPDSVEDRARIAEIHQLIARAEVLELNGEYAAAEDEARAALVQAQTSPYWPVRAEAGYRLGHILGSRGKANEANAELEMAENLALLSCLPDLAGKIAVYRAKLVAEDLRNAALGRELLGRAQALLVQGGLAPIEELAMERSRQENPHHADYLEARGLVATSDQDYDDARKAHEKALSIRKKLAKELAPDGIDLDTSKSYNNLANVWSYQKNHHKAIEHYQEAMRIREELLGKDHPLVAEVLTNMGHEWGLLEQFQDARDALQRALEIDRRVYIGTDIIKLLPDLVALGDLEGAALDKGHGDSARIRGICDEIRRIHSLISVEERRLASRAMEHNVLAACHRESNEIDKALGELWIAADILEPALRESDENAEEFLLTIYNIATVLNKRKKHEPQCSRLRNSLSLLAEYWDEYDPTFRKLEKDVHSACPDAMTR